MEIIKIADSLKFLNSIEEQNRTNFLNSIRFINEFSDSYKNELLKLPFHINIIDELQANENAHSRIFAQLLRYNRKTGFPILESFLNDLCGFKLDIEHPKIMKVDSCGRIDIPIFDKNFVIVIENKVTDKAIDQNNSDGGQLARYIETINKLFSRKLEEIYVVYTPKYTREPSDEVWLDKDNISLKESFRNRFASISFRDKIYPWLKFKVLPLINDENIYLRSATEQYIDHLEGLFSLRIINKPMNMKLQEFIKKELSIDDNNIENSIEILSEKEEELNNLLNQIKLLKSKFNKQKMTEFFKNFEELLRLDFSSEEIVRDVFKLDENVINVGVKFKYNNVEFVAIIECNNCDVPTLYYGIGRHYSSLEKTILPESLNLIMESNNLKSPEDYWYGWKYTNLENGYLELKSLIQEIVKSTSPNS